MSIRASASIGDSSSETDDEDSESSSSELTATEEIFRDSTRERTLEIFYEDWKREVAEKKCGGTRTSNGDSAGKRRSNDVIPIRHPETIALVECVGGEKLEHPPRTEQRDRPPVNRKVGGLLFDSTDFSDVCLEPEAKDTRRTHISVLPHELLLRIFRWAVGSHLDIRVLGNLACVCRGFYLLAYDQCLWRNVCLRLWPSLLAVRPLSNRNRGGLSYSNIPTLYGYTNWRDMAIRKPHVLLDGCYLCRISYVRAGEPAIGVSYRPFHIVVYYRGIRFYPDGRVEMLTSPGTPNGVVAALGRRKFVGSTSGTGQSDLCGDDTIYSPTGGLLQGTYKWCDPDMVVCTLFRPPPREPPPSRRRRAAGGPNPDLAVTFNIRFRLASSRRRLHNILHWDSYVIDTINKALRSEYSTALDVSSDQFPSCYFSRVRSYTSEIAPEPL
ncbi:unnamed protein product [Calicophoron daubneyi]|uniref:F-box domain-containing protein n=1 Tax=Calicophoron daubneyi TaxID=300641 RepID=A0AAV2TZB6_CALDB